MLLKYLLAPGECQVEKQVHLLPIKSFAILRGALHFNELAVSGGGDVHIHRGARVIVIIEIEAGFAIDEPDADRRQLVQQHGSFGS